MTEEPGSGSHLRKMDRFIFNAHFLSSDPNASFFSAGAEQREEELFAKRVQPAVLGPILQNSVSTEKLVLKFWINFYPKVTNTNL
jgi:hypothetical protein